MSGLVDRRAALRTISLGTWVAAAGALAGAGAWPRVARGEADRVAVKDLR